MKGARLAYLYTGSGDVNRDLGFYRDQLGGRVVWRIRSGGTEVAAVHLGRGPLILLADHRDAPSVLQIWAVDDLEGALAELKEAGWVGRERRVEVPDGPCLLLADPSGNEIALLDQVRPGILEHESPDEPPP